MIIIAGSLTLNPDKRSEALEAAAALTAETHKEEGCIEYVMYPDPHDETRIGIYERWESEEALKAHFAAPHMAEFQAQAGGFEISAMDVTSYDATERASLL